MHILRIKNIRKITTKELVISALLAALTLVATILIKIPTPVKGYINLGDAVVLISGAFLGPVCAFLSAGIGSMIADIISGYAVYAPVTFLIKGIMALVVHFGFKTKKLKPIFVILAEIFMVLGYFLFEGVLYGFTLSALNIPLNSVQGVVGAFLGYLLIRIFKKHKIFLNIKGE